jgi:hypothetical protein
VLERDGYCCTRCDAEIYDYNYSLQHRLPRGRGGKHSPENLATLCGSATTGCHQHVESYRSQATAEGWLVPSGIDPAEYPVLRGGSWVQPTASGWDPAEPHPLQLDLLAAVR